jgi:hypothetical protein
MRAWLEHERKSRERFVRDPIVIGLFAVFIPFVAFDIVGWDAQIVIATAFMVLLGARMIILDRAVKREGRKR